MEGVGLITTSKQFYYVFQGYRYGAARGGWAHTLTSQGGKWCVWCRSLLALARAQAQVQVEWRCRWRHGVLLHGVRRGDRVVLAVLVAMLLIVALCDGTHWRAQELIG